MADAIPSIFTLPQFRIMLSEQFKEWADGCHKPEQFCEVRLQGIMEGLEPMYHAEVETALNHFMHESNGADMALMACLLRWWDTERNNDVRPSAQRTKSYLLLGIQSMLDGAE